MRKHRIAMGVQYDGTHFHGWQSQPHYQKPETIQQNVEIALSAIAASPISVVCAGRTDAGVHANDQVIHFDTTTQRSIRDWLIGGNANLPADISFQWCVPVSDDFHARYSAQSREYIYRIYNHRLRPALWRQMYTVVHQNLNAKAMHVAAQHLVGRHDLTSFRSSTCQAKSPVREIHNVSVVRDGRFIEIKIKANAFLHHMVRNVVGTLLMVGRGERSPEWVADVLAARDRKQAGMTAPSAGLTLQHVDYPIELLDRSVLDLSLLDMCTSSQDG